MSYKFELICLSLECEGQTIKVYDGFEQAYKSLGDIEECPECGEEFEITGNHIFLGEVGEEIDKILRDQEQWSHPTYKNMTTIFSESDLGNILKAIEFSAFKHRFQRRKDREKIPYINHPIQVLGILWRIGKVRYIPILIAAILHDIIEDTDTKPEEISSSFGQEVLNLVLEVTDDKSLPKATRKQLQIENAPNKSTGAKLIKISDKISNVQSCPDWPKERFVEYLDWTEKVMKGLRGTNPELENFYDLALNISRKKIANWDTNE